MGDFLNAAGKISRRLCEDDITQNANLIDAVGDVIDSVVVRLERLEQSGETRAEVERLRGEVKRLRRVNGGRQKCSLAEQLRSELERLRLERNAAEVELKRLRGLVGGV
uniref:Uncharacterized protein n=1 Tax=viral metagenome TaxID=1070528 RepID=A0A6M3L0F7_9ZZZZ